MRCTVMPCLRKDAEHLRLINDAPEVSSGRGKPLPMLLILLLWSVFFLSQASAQNDDPDHFRIQYDSLILTSQDADTAMVNATVQKLLAINQQRSGMYDSLVISMLIWHYNWKSNFLPEDKLLSFLQSYRPVIEKMNKPFHADIARFYGLYIHVFWYHYQNDSIARYLDLIEQHINAEQKPVKQKSNGCMRKDDMLCYKVIMKLRLLSHNVAWNTSKQIFRTSSA